MNVERKIEYPVDRYGEVIEPGVMVVCNVGGNDLRKAVIVDIKMKPVIYRDGKRQRRGPWNATVQYEERESKIKDVQTNSIVIRERTDKRLLTII